MPMMSDSFMIMSSSPSSLISVPDHLPKSTRSPALTSSGCSLPSSPRAPGPTAITSPSIGFSLAVSGMMMPPAVLASCSTRRTSTRSCNGRNVIVVISRLMGCDETEGGLLALFKEECQQRFAALLESAIPLSRVRERAGVRVAAAARNHQERCGAAKPSPYPLRKRERGMRMMLRSDEAAQGVCFELDLV